MLFDDDSVWLVKADQLYFEEISEGNSRIWTALELDPEVAHQFATHPPKGVQWTLDGEHYVMQFDRRRARELYEGPMACIAERLADESS